MIAPFCELKKLAYAVVMFKAINNLTGILRGHCKLKAHLYRMGLKTNLKSIPESAMEFILKLGWQD